MAKTKNKVERKHYVFVYGTLMRGMRNHFILETELHTGHAKFIGEAETLINHGLYFFKYPWADINTFTDTGIKGEVYKVSEFLLHNRLDVLEGYSRYDDANGLYVRREVDVLMNNGGPTDATTVIKNGKECKHLIAHMYFGGKRAFKVDASEHIPSGDYRQWLNETINKR